MPVRSLSSPVLRWPDRALVERALAEWAASEAVRYPDLRAVGYFGSYARGDWGVGSDLDVVAIVAGAARSVEGRATMFETSSLPVPVDLFVYTSGEWKELLQRDDRLVQTLRRETVWVHGGKESLFSCQ